MANHQAEKQVTEVDKNADPPQPLSLPIVSNIKDEQEAQPVSVGITFNAYWQIKRRSHGMSKRYPPPE